MHALRHWYASVLLDGGESIKVVSAYLGHTDEGFHPADLPQLMPSSEDRARRVIDTALTRSRASDGPAKAQGSRQ